jgi:hypothetical protein
VPAFLVEHPAAGVVLIDTGFHPSVAADPKKNLGRLPMAVFKDVRMEPEQATAAQLRAKAIDPARVKVVVIPTCTWITRAPSRSSRAPPSCSAKRSGRPRRGRARATAT